MIVLLAACMGRNPGAPPREDTGTSVDDSAVPTPDSGDSPVDDSTDTTEWTPPDSEPCDTAVFFRDADGDGHGNRYHTITGCEPPEGYVADDVSDCDDRHIDAYYGATEKPVSGVDEDCDGTWSSVTVEDLDPWALTGAQDGARVGYKVTTRGDYNGDGAPDLAIGGNLTIIGDDARHAFGFVLDGPFDPTVGSLDETAADTTFYGAFDDDYATPCATGDLDGDGMDDLVVGSQDSYTGSLGSAYVLRGPLSGTLDMTTDVPGIHNAVWGEGFGVCAAPGDLTGDGLADLAVAARGAFVDGVAGAGRVYLFHGPVLQTSTDDADGVLSGDAESELIGFALGAVGDVDGDGVGDLGVSNSGGHYGYRDGTFVYLVTDPVVGVVHPRDVGITLEGDVRSDDTLSATSAGDLDGDGYDDLAVISGDAGSVYLALGPLSDTALSLSKTLDMTFTGRELVAVTPLVDWDGAGNNGIAIGDRSKSSPDAPQPDDVGAVYVLVAPIDPGTYTLSQSADELLGSQPDANMGIALDGWSDLDGDGRTDLAIGVPEWRQSYYEGATFVSFGGW